jgi:prepilin-type N-terminal cleavage/methylation domain-containing protein
MNKSTQYRTPTRGFTLLEVLVASMLIGLVIAALAVSSGAFTMANAAGVDLSTAEFLVEEIRERTAAMPFAGIADVSYKPPVDVDGAVMNEFAAFEQQVAVEYCGDDFGSPAADFVRITVTILKNDQAVSQASWIRAKL